MAESTDGGVFSFPKLGDFNYNSWKVDMKVLLMEKGCWDFITGKEKPLPDDATERDKLAYSLRKQRAFTTIYMGIERKYQALIADTEDGKTAWETLKVNFEPTSRARLASLVDDFFSTRFLPNEETIGIYSKRIVEKNKQIKDAGFQMPSILACFQLIRYLPPEYENLVQILYRVKDEEFTIDSITKQLITESGRIELKQKDENKFPFVTDAFTAKVTKIGERRFTERRNSVRGSMMDPPNAKLEKPGAPVTCKYC